MTQPRSADLALVGGNVLALDEDDRVESSVAVSGNRVLALGSDNEVKRLIGRDTFVLELDGRTVVPGFIDAHAHVELSAYGRHIWQDIRDLSRRQICELIEKLAASSEQGQWIVAQGTFGQDLPTRAELTLAAPHSPVVLRWSMHRLVANDCALEVGGISASTPDEVGTRIGRTTDGELTGVIEEGFDLLPVPAADAGLLAGALSRLLSESFLRQGVTSVYEIPISSQAVSAYQRMARDGELPVRLSLAYTVAPGHQPLIGPEHLSELGIQSGFGDDWLNIAGIKIFVDGDEDASLWRNQLHRPPQDWGLMTRTPQQLGALVTRAVQAGIQCWIHAIGDLAQEFAFGAVEMSMRACGRSDHRTRIEHLANECTDLSQVTRMKELGVIPVPTASFLHTAEPSLKTRLGPQGGAFIFRSLLEAGLRPPGNADNAGTMPYALNPLFGIHCMVARRNARGELIDEGQRISAYDALKVQTSNGAIAGFHERSRGSLERGKLADIVVLSDDPTSVDVDELLDIRVDHTILDGELRYSREQ